MIRQLLLLSGRRYIVGYSDQLVSQFLDWANTKLVECHAIQASFQLLLVMTCLKTATAFLSNIPERKESMNLETNYKILTAQDQFSLIRPAMPMILTPLTIFSSKSTPAYLSCVSLLRTVPTNGNYFFPDTDYSCM